MRRTKIIATVGPATGKPGMLEKMLRAGVDLFRINYSHQSHADHEASVTQIRQISARLGIEVGIIADLQGPKIRLERFRSGTITLAEGSKFTLDGTLAAGAGDDKRVGITYRELARDVSAGDTLLLDDGRIVLEVIRSQGRKVHCRVKIGGELANNKGINILGGGLSAKSLTDKDKRDLAHGIKIGADYFAVSFVRNSADIKDTRRLLKQGGSKAGVIAKLERAEAIAHARTIIKAADAIMIARGDLGVEIGDAALPPVQKNLIKMARQMDRAVITATQMMESMIENQIPLRAEVFDVANAVLDGTDAVMLSGETSIGLYPDKVVEAMARICEETEKQRDIRVSDHRINQQFAHIDEAIAMAAMYTANQTGTRAIAALTETGSTCLWMSRISSGIPIYAFTRNLATVRKTRLYRGVYPVYFDITHTDPLEANAGIINELIARQAVHNGDLVIITKGDLRGRRGGTNNLKIVRVGLVRGHTI
ncbi:MAG: pyruvate kinase [Gammaproteobacteria bacterium RIFCSPLOWO2_12_FULL_52_10]|nr:MAG: pyruvate kinase [Gammaproteobacteria bacterium RIFCSPLOWO2_12_FULL_52_10]